MGPFNMPNMLVFIESASIQNMCNKSRLIPSINGHNLDKICFNSLALINTISENTLPIW